MNTMKSNGEQKTPDIRVRTSHPFKLKDKDKRHYIPIHLEKMFGFVPEVIIVEKIPGKNNTMIVRAVMTEEEIKKEDKLKKMLVEKKPKIILPGK